MILIRKLPWLSGSMLALESGDLGSNPSKGRNLFTEIKLKKWAEFGMVKNVNKTSSKYLFQKDFSSSSSIISLSNYLCQV